MSLKNIPNKSSRNLSLDLFRGITVFWMVVVNNPGSWTHIFPLLKHADWNGLLSADLVFPFFLIAVGASIPLAYRKRISLGETNKEIFSHVLIRTFFLFGVGFLMNGFPNWDWENWRIPGVLQRIAIVYLFGYISFIWIPKIFRLIFFPIFLIFYTWLIVFSAPPDWIPFNQSSLDVAFSYTAQFNWSAYLDRLILGDHLWRVSKFWDPEGILSTIPAIMSAWLGIFLTERKSYSQSDLKSKDINFYFLAISSTLLMLIGYLGNFIFPINKGIWSSSFVLVTGGYAYLLIILLSLWKVYSWNNWLVQLFQILGKSALFVFIFTGMLSRILTIPAYGISPKIWITSQLQFFLDPRMNSLLYTLVYLSYTISITLLWYYGKIWITSYIRLMYTKR